MSEDSSIEARKSYLAACSVAVLAAVLGVAFNQTDNGGGLAGGARLIVVGIAAVGILGWVVFKLRNMPADSGPDHPADRLRKMTFLWLGLAAVLGVALVRVPVVELVDGRLADLSRRHWGSGVAGIGVVAVVIWRGVVALKRSWEKSDD